MKTDSQILANLNEMLALELTSINRYFLHARMHGNWGFEALNKRNFKKSIKDMKQADELIERILMLEGLPNLQKLGALQIGEDTAEMFQCDASFQTMQITALKNAISVCESMQDFVSRAILEGILSYEEDHLDWIETQQYQIGQMGVDLYLQAQISEGE
ncbi:MAG: bacterioferritin [Flavobacteriales bacterium]|jgi:bacterioferritin